MNLSFKCPDCGGSSFGSSWISGFEGPAHRYCHGNGSGNGRAGCRFNWPEQDDWKHFSCNGEKVKTAEEYQAVLQKIRSTPVFGDNPRG